MSENTSRLTVVLIHGAFADASSWNGVIERLQTAGTQVIAPPNPLRGPAFDSAYVASLVRQIDGAVLLVGHSYGGAVITNAAGEAPNVVGLVYVCAFVPDEGETLQALAATSKDSMVLPALKPMHYPRGTGEEQATEFFVDPSKVHEVFCADLDSRQAALLAVTQRPLSELAFTDVTGVPAWKTLPSWAVVGTQDRTVGTDIARSMAQRADAMITEVDGSHVIMMSKPQAVADVILQAAAEVSGSAGDMRSRVA